ncbi:LysM peptidoglycan-binding domain-containing protein [Candidatus Berkiella cookevillensis]|uniref:LysM domain/BON superfamily protein n=1 Tax=Candidatus Berkiella cookevillensis TaxID=437022 RepID=A0A0Q9YEE8_9GAMM|nr:LysM domain-containing protein [Candidatus Berkiella cookevillensis]MCS5707296.1 LysM peptidoglycan-binding domain-containing protein [Candidatus Berkiella cookevillensis]
MSTYVYLQRFLTIAVVLLGFCFIVEAKPAWIQEKAPEVYVVKKGDTLWEIAGIYLKEPWRWIEIWDRNPNISNPHLIYPGDKILLSYDANGTPKLSLERGSKTPNAAYWEGGTRVVKLSPTIREGDAEGAIPTVPTRVIQPFFNRSQVISQAHVDFCPNVIALDEDHLVVGAGDRIYASKVDAHSATEMFSVFRVEKLYKDPKSNEVLGIEGLILGNAQVEFMGDPTSLILKQSYSEIRVGDKLIEPTREQVDAFFFPKAPDGDPTGQIISVFDGISQIGQYQVIVMTGGKNQLREVGDVLAVYQKQKDLPTRIRNKKETSYDFPALKIGRLVVFRVFDKVSYGLVMNATRPIYLKDEVGEP